MSVEKWKQDAKELLIEELRKIAPLVIERVKKLPEPKDTHTDPKKCIDSLVLSAIEAIENE